ncbi:MAG: prepilin peptidase [Proteobacteria bacterium]|nr:prepilin peptidase [Pseudomonadota bacterium]
MSLTELLASSPRLFIGTCFVLGLAIGSFLNVVIHRLPLMLERQWREQCLELASNPGQATHAPDTEPIRFNLMVPRSACPFCKAPIKAWQNVPVVSWLALKGRCAQCRHPIAARYPLVELLTGVLSASVAWRFGFGQAALAGLLVTWFLVALTFIDIDHQLLPDDLTLPLLWLGLAAALWNDSSSLGVPTDLRSGVIGAIAGYVSLWSVYHLFRLITGKEGMGHGDFKLFSALGAWLGWQMLIPIILIAAVSGAIVGIVVLSARGQQRSTPIAFGPFLAVAGWLVMMFGPALVSSYLGLFK